MMNARLGVLPLTLCLFTTIASGQSQLISNGDFETGTFAPWTTVDLLPGAGAFFVHTGTTTPQSGLSTVGPAGGTYYALSDQLAPGTHALIQAFTVPAPAASVILEFDMFVNNSAGAPIIDPIGLDHRGPANQHARVDILTAAAGPFDTGAGVLANYYIGTDGLPAQPYTHYTFNITSVVGAGGTFQLRFAETDNQANLNQGVDNVSILYTPVAGNCPSGCVPPPGGMVAWWMFDESTPPAAADSALTNHGLHQNGPVIASGVVGKALDFDGIDDYVIVTHDPSLNFGPANGPGQGDFSIDAWVRLDQLTGEHMPIVEKRDAVRGYYLYIIDAVPVLSMADGAGPVDYCCSTPIPIGVPTHIAVSVDRDDPQGVKMYVNGQPAGVFDPTLQNGDLSNAEDLLIGTNTYSFVPGFPPTFFDGLIDEVEIFQRALSAAEIADIHSRCKCRHRCHVPRRTSFCLNQNAKTVTVQVCNYGTSARDFNVTMNGTAGCPQGLGCNIPGPTAADFTILTPLPINVPAGQCAPVQVRISRPSQMTAPGLTACFEATVTALDNGQSATCCGSLIDRRNWCAVVGSHGPFFPLPPSSAYPVSFEIENTGDASTLDYMLFVAQPDGEPVPVGLDGLPPGTPVTGTLDIPSGESAPIEVTVELEQFVPFAASDLVLLGDVDGDGAAEEPLASVTLHPVLTLPCPADLTGDGVVNVGDLLALLDNWGGSGDGDLNSDGIVNIHDLLVLLDAWGDCP